MYGCSGAFVLASKASKGLDVNCWGWLGLRRLVPRVSRSATGREGIESKWDPRGQTGPPIFRWARRFWTAMFGDGEYPGLHRWYPRVSRSATQLCRLKTDGERVARPCHPGA